MKDLLTHPTISFWGLDVYTLIVYSAFGRPDPRKRPMNALEIDSKPFERLREKEVTTAPGTQ